jgi:glycosyltransferase involved in cell wall biosynthesis
MLRIVAATRFDPAEFMRNTLLGRSFSRFSSGRGTLPVIAYSNSRGLSEVFNTALMEAGADDEILFTHDDVWIDDWLVRARISDALARFDVIGVAGNRRRLPGQASWAFVGDPPQLDRPECLSGAVAHVDEQKTEVSYFGDSPSEVKLLDGVFLAAAVRTLRSADVRFDPRFTFHFYDMDFCRSCERAGLSMGTWPIAITHRSAGDFRSPAWRESYADYVAKWHE